jgi:hypothetical protein
MPATRVWAPHRIRIEALHQTAKQPDKVQLADLGGTTSRLERGRRPAGRIGAPLGGPPSLVQAASPSPTDQFFVQGLVPTVRVVFGFGRLAWWPGSLRGAAQASRSHHLVYRSFASWGRRPPGQRGGTGLGPTRRRRAWAAQRYRQSPWGCPSPGRRRLGLQAGLWPDAGGETTPRPGRHQTTPGRHETRFGSVEVCGGEQAPVDRAWRCGLSAGKIVAQPHAAAA